MDSPGPALKVVNLCLPSVAILAQAILALKGALGFRVLEGCVEMVSALDMRSFLKANVSSELTYLWDDQEVPLTLQFEVGQLYKSVKLFASMADSRTEVRGMATDFKLDLLSTVPATRSEARSNMAMLVACWESAREFTSKEATLRAEAKVLQVSRPVGQLERSAMKEAVEAI